MERSCDSRGSTEHLYFGHHGGILESTNGGRTWAPLPVAADAVGMCPAADGSIVIAGHEVFVGSADGGRTWAPIESDLPNIDIHAFTRDPLDPQRMWAYLAEGGVYGSTDGGARWMKVYGGHVPFMAATIDGHGGRPHRHRAVLGLRPEHRRRPDVEPGFAARSLPDLLDRGHARRTGGRPGRVERPSPVRGWRGDVERDHATRPGVRDRAL